MPIQQRTRGPCLPQLLLRRVKLHILSTRHGDQAIGILRQHPQALPLPGGGMHCQNREMRRRTLHQPRVLRVVGLRGNLRLRFHPSLRSVGALLCGSHRLDLCGNGLLLRRFIDSPHVA